MRHFKIYTKVFFYTLVLMLFIVIVAHGLIYFLTPKAVIDISSKPEIDGLSFTAEFNAAQFTAQAILRVLPISLAACFVISAVCSLLFSREITGPIKQISMTAAQMAQLDRTAACSIPSHDEIGLLAENINGLYHNLLSTIEHLEREKQHIRESEQSKVNFLRAASHELKTPVTALNATLENMILGVGRYQDTDVCLPECKEITEQLAEMIHNILEASRAGLAAETENPEQTDLSQLLPSLCEPSQLIAAARGIVFHLILPDGAWAVIPPGPFRRAVSNILSNAVSYTEPENTVSVYCSENNLVIENECEPVPQQELPHLFEPFYRPDFARGRDTGGNGLGLYIVDNLSKSMNLSYSFRPMEKPQGMRFIIHLGPPSP